MCYKHLSMLSVLAFMLVSANTLACGPNEYEWCWDIGLAKDCKCLPKVDGDLGRAAEDTKRETNKLVENLARELGKTPQAISECFSNVPRCANEIASAPLALPIQAYLDGLYRQSEGRTYSFSPEFIYLAQPYYSVDLRTVTFANDINTSHGMTVAYCDRIFFAGHGNLWQDENELHHVLHELEHIVQCQGRGQRTYLAEYILKAGIDVVKSGRFNVHDIHDYEVAAEAKANQLTSQLWNKIVSGATPIQPGARGSLQPSISVSTPQVGQLPPGYGVCRAGYLVDPSRVGPKFQPCGNLTGYGGVWPGTYQ